MNGGINRYGDQLEETDPRNQYLDVSTQLNGVNRSATEMLSRTDFQNNVYPEPTVGGDFPMDVNMGDVPGAAVAGDQSTDFNQPDYERDWVPSPSRPQSDNLTHENCWECMIAQLDCGPFPESPLAYRYV